MKNLIEYSDLRPALRGEVDVQPPADDRVEVRYVVVQSKEETRDRRTPWGRIIIGCLLGLFMILSFGQWAITEVLKVSERSSERSYQLARQAISSASDATYAASKVVESSSSYGTALLVVIIVIAFLFILRGLR